MDKNVNVVTIPLSEYNTLRDELCGMMNDIEELNDALDKNKVRVITKYISNAFDETLFDEEFKNFDDVKEEVEKAFKKQCEKKLREKLWNEVKESLNAIQKERDEYEKQLRELKSRNFWQRLFNL